MALPLFETVSAKGRAAYKVYAASMLVAISLIFFYRLTHIPESGKWAWVGLIFAELWFTFYWITTQTTRWNPIYRRTFKERLEERYGTKLPGVDIFLCTADPEAEPPSLVISTVLSLLAYDYPTEKLNVYVSDDAGSELTFYALWEMSRFARHWLPFCRRFKVEPTSPVAYFAKFSDPQDSPDPVEWSSVKELFEAMMKRIEFARVQGKIPDELKQHKGFSEWSSGITSRNHQPIVQILIDGRDEKVIDTEGSRLPTLVYLAREKRPQHHHNFKAGAMNALIRVSSEISNNPIILNVDCDMYSNNSETIKDALCFFLDEDNGHDIGFIQYPQNFDNITKNDLYASSFVVTNEEIHGFDYWGGPPYIGTGCFNRRELLCGREYSKDYKEDWEGANKRKLEESASILEERAKTVATCTYEQNTKWGTEIGVRYDSPAEDLITGLSIHCRGWKSVYFNPSKKSFVGVAPTTLAQTLVQHKRWGEGNLRIMASKYTPFLYGHGKMRFGHRLAYHIHGMWSGNSLPTMYYLAIPSLCLLKGISLFPKVSSLWFIPFAYVAIARQAYSLMESQISGETLKAWWNSQRIWIYKRITSYFYATIDTVFSLIGLSQMAFVITAKVTDGDVSKRYEQEVMEFGESSSMFTIIATYALLNLVCLVGGLKRVMVDEVVDGFESFLLQLILSGVVVLINEPVYEAMFLRKDKGSIPTSIIFSSSLLVIFACLFPIF